ncbi:MAG TPA: serine/threonine-protein kinase [Kineosporiaceae bacterium]
MTAGTTRDPATVGPYRLIRKLGEGGMGVVHLAVDPAGRPVALKVLRAQVANDSEARRRLAREVVTLRRVRHPLVAEVLDADVSGDEPYLVTRFVPGRSLEDEVRAEGALPSGQVARIGRDLAGALAGIHGVGVVHRDLKPANVMMVDGEPVLIDFGIAHVADESRITRTGLVMGTPGYLSPELIYGDPVTAATDWWAWGATLAFAATGRQPFGTGPVEVVLERVRRGAADLDGVDPTLRDLLGRTLTVDPAGRPRATQLISGLEAIIAGMATGPASAASRPDQRAGPFDRTVRTSSSPPPAPLGERGASRASVRPSPRSVTSRAATDGSLDRTIRTAAPSPPPGPPPPASRGSVPYPAASAPRGSVGPAPAPPYPPAYPAAGGRQPVPYPPEQYPYPVASPYQGPAPSPGYGPARGHPPATAYREPPRDRDRDRVDDLGAADEGPRRVTGTLAAGMAALCLVATVAPGSALMLAVLFGIVARTVQRSTTGLERRRSELGRSRADVAVTVVALPWRLLLATLNSLAAAILPFLVSVSAAFIVGTSPDVPRGPYPTQPLALLVGMAAGIATAWWGPGGRSLRTGTRAIARSVTASRAGQVVVLVICTLVGLAVVMVLAQPGGMHPDWSPFAPPSTYLR